MTIALYVLGVLVVVVGVGASIALHELGHLIPAKRFGVRCTQYMIGFGPTLYSRTSGDTEYGVKAIPLGGYVRMIGMFPPRPGDDPDSVRASSTGRFSQLIDEARKTSAEDVGPQDRDRVFYKLASWRKVVVMLGGPTMNLLIAVVLIGGLITIYGSPVPKDSAEVAAVYKCVATTQTAATVTDCPDPDQQTPAYRAGLQPGDVLVSIDGQPVTSSAEVGRLISPRAGQATDVVVNRDGSDLRLTVTPITNTLPVYDESGQPVLNSSGQPTYHQTGFLGISSATPTVIERQPVTAVPGVVWDYTAATAGVVLKIPQKMVGVAQAAFSGETRDPNGPISVVGVGRIAGEVTSGAIPGLPQDPATIAALLVQLIAGLNIALFVFNLIPLLPLDGGHVAGALWEGLRRQLARLRGRPDPGYVDVAKALPLAYVMSIGLIVMSVLLIYADLVNPVKLGG
ncbi:MAG: M50 family metallopeptidase [Nostocoides sp.]